MHLGKLHIVIVHFPIALAIAAVSADFLWLVTRRLFFKNAGLYCLLGALVVTPLVVLTGWLLLNSLGFTGDAADLAEDHEHFGMASLGVIIAAAIVRIWWIKKPAPWMPWVYGALAAALLVCISIAGDLGGKLVWGENFFADIL